MSWNTFCVCLKQTLAREGFNKKTIESVIMIISRRNKVKEARSIWSLILKIVWNWNFVINTKFVLGLNRVNQLGLVHWRKKPKGVWSPPADSPPPAGYGYDHRFNRFFWPLPLVQCTKSPGCRNICTMSNFTSQGWYLHLSNLDRLWPTVLSWPPPILVNST